MFYLKDNSVSLQGIEGVITQLCRYFISSTCTEIHFSVCCRHVH